VLVADGAAVVDGHHRELLRSHAGYRDVVTRGEEDDG
jgi:hypothetical protein